MENGDVTLYEQAEEYILYFGLQFNPPRNLLRFWGLLFNEGLRSRVSF